MQPNLDNEVMILQQILLPIILHGPAETSVKSTKLTSKLKPGKLWLNTTCLHPLPFTELLQQ